MMEVVDVSESDAPRYEIASLAHFPEFFWRGRDVQPGLRPYLSDAAVIEHVMPAWRRATPPCSGRLALAATVVEDLLDDKWRLIEAVNRLTDTRWHRWRRRLGLPVRLDIPHHEHVRVGGPRLG